MITNRTLTVGTRVRIIGSPSGIELRSPTGEIVRRDDLESYYVVRLDEPAMLYDVPGTGEEIVELVEAGDNLEVVDTNR